MDMSERLLAPGVAAQVRADEGDGDFLEFVSRIALLSDESAVEGIIDGLLFHSETHSLVFWTMDVSGRREIVGMEALPRDERDPRALTSEWLAPRLEQFRKVRPTPAPLPAGLLRHGISFREVMRARGEVVEMLARPEIAGFDISAISGDQSASAGITSRELKRLENLLDAVIYDRAVRENFSPVKRIAEYRHISDRTAEGRIARSRAMGFLTPAQGRRASGGLTEQAHDLLSRLDELHAIIRPEGGPDRNG